MRRTRRSRRARGWTDAHLLQLRCGHDFFREAWGDKPFSEETLLDMRQAWARHGEEVELEHQESHKQPASRCWGWWQFESPVPLRYDVPEWYQLHQLGICTDEQARAAAEKQLFNATRNPYHVIAFRRLFAWWHYRSPEPRNAAKLELSQLVDLHRRYGEILAPIECALLAGDEAVCNSRYRHGQYNWATHLDPAERLLLGLTESQPITIAE